MRIEKVAQRFQAVQTLLRCPLCGRPLIVEANTLACETGHRFDLSGKNYANLAPWQKQGAYRRAMFESRAAVFESGFYRPVADAVKALVPERARCVLDAGCGEGYYAARLAAKGRRVLAADLSKDAVALAARRPGVHALVADLARLPLKDGTVDVVLDILSPANYAEFARVLTPDGRIVKVAPGRAYLEQVRALTGKRAYDDARVFSHFQAHTADAAVRELRYTRPVTRAQAQQFLRMTPLALHMGPYTERALFDEITIHLLVMTGRCLQDRTKRG